MAIVGVWLAATLAIFVAMDAWLGVLVVLLFPFWLLPTLALAVVCLTVGILRLSRGALLLAPGMLGAVGLLVVLGGPLADLGVRLRFIMERPAYEREVASLVGGSRPKPMGKVPGTSSSIVLDEAQSGRLGFDWGVGLADDWSGVIYDPTDTMPSRAQVAALKGPERPFRHGLQGCRRLSRHYYLCDFS